MSTLDLQSLLQPRRTGSTIPAPVVEARPEREESGDKIVQASWDTYCEVLRFLHSDDGYGGSIEQWTQAGKYPCRVWMAGPDGQEGATPASGVLSEVRYLVSLPRYAHIRNDDRLGIPGWFNAWRAENVYSHGDFCIPNSPDPGFYYECMRGGESGLAEPTWPTQIGVAVTDDGAFWKCAGRVNFLEVVGSNDALTTASELVIYAKELS